MDFHTSSIDIFACGSTIGNLSRFVQGSGKPLRFCVEVIGNTVFFFRQMNDPKELIEDVRGYGHTFPEAYTTWDKYVKGSETSQRVVQYEFGGLQCMVRFECDGYIDKSTSERAARTEATDQASYPNDLLSALYDTSITSKQAVTNTLTVKTGGEVIAQSSIFDLKTRSIRSGREIDMDDVYPLLWIKQVPNFIIAYHDGKGIFEDIRVQNIEAGVQKWQEDNAQSIHRVAIVLNKTVKFAKEKRGLLEVYYSGADNLEIRSQHGKGVYALPTALADRWAEDGCTRNNDADREISLMDEPACCHDDVDDSDDGEKDYTACSASDCGYCGECTY